MTIQNKPPVWHNELSLIIPSPLPYIADWLKTQILSKALRALVPNLSLQVIKQAQSLPHPDEAIKLNLAPTDIFPLIRQVKIGGYNKPNLYCRVVIPNTLYQQEQETFDQLGSRFIGETVLYHQPNVHRSLFDYAVLTPEHTLYKEAIKNTQDKTPQSTYYARRSLFYLPVLPLLITEVFLHVVALS